MPLIKGLCCRVLVSLLGSVASQPRNAIRNLSLLGCYTLSDSKTGLRPSSRGSCALNYTNLCHGDWLAAFPCWDMTAQPSCSKDVISRLQEVVHQHLLRPLALGWLASATVRCRAVGSARKQDSLLVVWAVVGTLRRHYRVVAHHFLLPLRVHRDLINVFVVSMVAAVSGHGGSRRCRGSLRRGLPTL